MNAICTSTQPRTSALNRIVTSAFAVHLFALCTAGCVLAAFAVAQRLV